MIDGAPPLTRRRQTKTGEIYFDENEEYLSDADTLYVQVATDLLHEVTSPLDRLPSE